MYLAHERLDRPRPARFEVFAPVTPGRPQHPQGVQVCPMVSPKPRQPALKVFCRKVIGRSTSGVVGHSSIVALASEHATRARRQAGGCPFATRGRARPGAAANCSNEPGSGLLSNPAQRVRRPLTRASARHVGGLLQAEGPARRSEWQYSNEVQQRRHVPLRPCLSRRVGPRLDKAC
jgi:hypothetical protein